jgi:hypothetical protein
MRQSVNAATSDEPRDIPNLDTHTGDRARRRGGEGLGVVKATQALFPDHQVTFVDSEKAVGSDDAISFSHGVYSRSD